MRVHCSTLRVAVAEAHAWTQSSIRRERQAGAARRARPARNAIPAKPRRETASYFWNGAMGQSRSISSRVTHGRWSHQRSVFSCCLVTRNVSSFDRIRHADGMTAHSLRWGTALSSVRVRRKRTEHRRGLRFDVFRVASRCIGGQHQLGFVTRAGRLAHCKRVVFIHINHAPFDAVVG